LAARDWKDFVRGVGGEGDQQSGFAAKVKGAGVTATHNNETFQPITEHELSGSGTG